MRTVPERACAGAPRARKVRDRRPLEVGPNPIPKSTRNTTQMRDDGIAHPPCLVKKSSQGTPVGFENILLDTPAPQGASAGRGRGLGRIRLNPTNGACGAN